MTLHYLHPSGVHLSYDPETDDWTEVYPSEPAEPPFGSTDLYGIFLLVCSLVVAVILGYWWGAS